MARIDKEDVWAIVLATLVVAIFVLILTGTVHTSDPDCGTANACLRD